MPGAAGARYNQKFDKASQAPGRTPARVTVSSLNKYYWASTG